MSREKFLQRRLRNGWRIALAAVLPLGLAPCAAPVLAQPPAPIARPAPTYADLADLADSAPLVLQLQLRKQAAIEPTAAANVKPGWARLYLEARLMGVLHGSLPGAAAAGGKDAPVLAYLADVPLDARGKMPSLGKAPVLVFARPAPANADSGPQQLQLVAPDAQFAWDPALDARVRSLLAELAAPDAPPHIRGVREAMYVAGTLAGEGETQMFLATAGSSPAAISVEHKPGQPISWSVSFSEVVNPSGTPPVRETLAWYRLACFLPRRLPATANVSESDADKAQATEDYRLVLDQLGTCTRTLQ
jgi:hypothetical protein